MDPPVVPRARLDGWQCIDETTERAFTAGFVSVDASTVRYERDATEPPRPFCFASRLRIRPATAPNPALTALVERRARSGFRDRLAERDIEDIEHRGDREIAVDDPKASRATLSTFRGVTGVGSGDRRVPVEALLASGRPASIYSAGARTPSTRRRTRPERARATRVENCWGSFAGWSHPTTAAKRSYKRLRPANTEPRPRPSRSATPRRDTRSRRSIRRTSGAEVRRRTARQTPRTGRHRSRWPPARSA